MRIINNNGFTREELAGWRTIVYRNMMESAQAIIKAMRQFEYSYSSDKTEVRKKQWTGMYVYYENRTK